MAVSDLIKRSRNEKRTAEDAVKTKLVMRGASQALPAIPLSLCPESKGL